MSRVDGALKAQERSKRRRRAGALNRLLGVSMSAFLGDCVANLFFGVRTKFCRGAGALTRKLCRGSRDQPVIDAPSCGNVQYD
jgi:hypothetical protein